MAWTCHATDNQELVNKLTGKALTSQVIQMQNTNSSAACRLADCFMLVHCMQVLVSSRQMLSFVRFVLLTGGSLSPTDQGKWTVTQLLSVVENTAMYKDAPSWHRTQVACLLGEG